MGENAKTAPQWARWELPLTAAGDGDGTGDETALTADLFAPDGTRRRIHGFWDGGATWRLRYMPDTVGKWTYRTHSLFSGLDGIEGAFTCTPAEARTPFARHGAIRVSPDRHRLQHADGTPFFWLGDTVWSGPALCPTLDDWEFYLRTRTEQRFTVAQFNAVCPWRAALTDADGRTAFTGRESITIDPAYFQRLDRYMDAINAHGLLASPVLIWSLTAKDPGSYLPEADCIRLARYQVARYQGHHVLWILAGDNPYDTQTAEKWKRVGRAVFGTGDDPAQAPVTTHPTGHTWPWEEWRGEAWLTVLGYQSGHGDGADAYRWLHSGPPHRNRQAVPPRPVLNLEPPYEGHNGYQSGQPHSADSVRRAVYWSLLGSCTAGVTYGGQGVWSWHTEPGTPPADHPGAGVAPHWQDALKLPGGIEMGFVRDLFESLPWWTLHPAEELLVTQPGTDDPAAFISVSQSADGKTVVAYLPVGGEVRLRAERLPSPVRAAEWFDPRTGNRQPASNRDSGIYTAPSAGAANDWVLILREGQGA